MRRLPAVLVALLASAVLATSAAAPATAAAPVAAASPADARSTTTTTAPLDAGSTPVTAPAPAAAAGTTAFTAAGSIGQVYTYGHPAGSTVELRDGSGQLVASKAADTQGAALFRDLAPGGGYTVTEGGQTSGPLTVTTVDQNPPQSFYQSTVLHAGFGYIPTRDGTLLSANITFPNDGTSGPWPVVVDYSGYDPSQPGQVPPEAQVYTALGYVVAAVNMRGTTCSGGAFWFFEDAQRTDGYDAIEAVANQSWSTGDVGMVGISYSGYSQLYVAATRPPHLRAITPLSPFSDGYRGILYPGGILNDGFALNWALDRQEASAPAAHSWVRSRINNGDTTCAQNQVMRLQSQDLQGEITPGRFDDPQYSYLRPSSFAPLIEVPTLLVTQWQDEQTGGYGAELATEISKHAYLRAEFTNGTHADPLGPEDFLRVVEFVELFVGKRVPKLIGNGFYRQGIADALQGVFGVPITLPWNRFDGYDDYGQALAFYESEDPIRIRWENGGRAGQEGAPYATVTTTYPAWPIPGTIAQRWYLRADGQLSALKASSADTSPRSWSSYTYDPTVKRTSTYTGSTGSMWLSHPDVHWDTEVEGDSLSFVTPAYSTFRSYAGNGSVDLWLRSSAADTDLEVTLTEVRPDGSEVYIQSGWLRASRRALDQGASTDLRPRSTFQSADASPLPAGQFVPVRIELFPFAHIVRPGSRLRLNIEAPGGNQPFWAFDALPGTATNDIGHSAGMPSSVVLPLVFDGRVKLFAPATAPSCSVAGVTTQSQSLRNQPCRPYQPARAPTNAAASVTGGVAHVTWKAPALWAGSPAVTGYRIVASNGDTADVGPDARSFDYTRPSAGGPAIWFRVAALFGTTEGPLSTGSNAISMIGPSFARATPGDGSAVVRWFPPFKYRSTITGYEITPVADGVAGTPQSFGTATTQTVTGLDNGTTYSFLVRAIYANGTGAPSLTAPVVVGAPSAPAFLQVAAAGPGQVQVRWWPVAPNASPVTAYVVTTYADGVAQPPQTFPPSGNGVVVGGLSSGVAYTFTVAAVNDVGTSPTSGPSPSITL